MMRPEELVTERLAALEDELAALRAAGRRLVAAVECIGMGSPFYAPAQDAIVAWEAVDRV